jgi:long-subunit fatty acid transport protein
LNNANGISLSELTTLDDETIDDLYDFLGNNYGYSAQQAFLGYQGFIIDPISNDENNNSYVSSAKYDQVNHDFYIDKMGDHKKYSFTLSTQYNESIYLGLNLNSHHINFQEVTDLTESNYLTDSNIDYIQFNNDLFTYGKGFSAQIGIIAKVKNNLRLGFSYQSPTRFNLTEESMQFIISDYSIMDSVEELSRSIVDPQILNIYDYKLSTPSKTSFSASMVFGSKGLISAEYSSKNYGNINFISDRNPYLRGLNQELKTNYKNASMFRIGGEIRQNKLSLRAGYYAEESSIKNNDNSHYGSSFGIGYDFKNGSIISLSLVSSNINHVNSLSSSGIEDTFTSNTKRNSISMSYNLKL